MGLNAGNYWTVTGVALATATGDLADLVEKGALIRIGERRYARNRLAIDEGVDSK
jgi:Fic family protein